jgi:signal peptidase I
MKTFLRKFASHFFLAYNASTFTMSLFSFKNKSTPSEHIIPHTGHETPIPEKKENALLDIVRFSLIALIIVIPIRTFIAQPFIVSGASMENTFHTGEYLIVDQLSYELHDPKRGEVIVFRYPKDPSKFFIKRVIALPGETITIEGSTVRISNPQFPNGFILDEPYIKSMENGIDLTEELGEREYFVMGDNRDQSSDSRFWGVLQEERIVGRAFVRLFPPSQLDYLPGALEDTVITNQP